MIRGQSNGKNFCRGWPESAVDGGGDSKDGGTADTGPSGLWTKERRP